MASAAARPTPYTPLMGEDFTVPGVGCGALGWPAEGMLRARFVPVHSRPSLAPAAPGTVGPARG